MILEELDLDVLLGMDVLRRGKCDILLTSSNCLRFAAPDAAPSFPAAATAAHGGGGGNGSGSSEINGGSGGSGRSSSCGGSSRGVHVVAVGPIIAGPSRGKDGVASRSGPVFVEVPFLDRPGDFSPAAVAEGDRGAERHAARASAQLFPSPWSRVALAGASAAGASAAGASAAAGSGGGAGGSRAPGTGGRPQGYRSAFNPAAAAARRVAQLEALEATRALAAAMDADRVPSSAPAATPPPPPAKRGCNRGDSSGGGSGDREAEKRETSKKDNSFSMSGM